MEGFWQYTEKLAQNGTDPVWADKKVQRSKKQPRWTYLLFAKKKGGWVFWAKKAKPSQAGNWQVTCLEYI